MTIGITYPTSGSSGSLNMLPKKFLAWGTKLGGEIPLGVLFSARADGSPDGKRVIVGMSQGEHCLELVIAGDSPHRPASLPASPVELTVFHDDEFARPDIVVAVSPKLLGRKNQQADRQSPAHPRVS